MSLLIVVLAILALFQVGLLVYALSAKDVPLMKTETHGQTKKLIHLVKIRNRARSIHSFARLLSHEGHGSLTLSQLEFIRHIEEASEEICQMADRELHRKPLQEAKNNSSEAQKLMNKPPVEQAILAQLSSIANR